MRGRPCLEGCTCRRHAADVRAQKRITSSGRHYSPETRAKMRASMLARTPVPGLVGMHFRLRAQRGRATDQVCVDCDGPAAEWSYEGRGCPEFRDTKTGQPYSTDLNAYSPRCVRCHRLYDSPKHPRRKVTAA